MRGGMSPLEIRSTQAAAAVIGPTTASIRLFISATISPKAPWKRDASPRALSCPAPAASISRRVSASIARRFSTAPAKLFASTSRSDCGSICTDRSPRPSACAAAAMRWT